MDATLQPYLFRSAFSKKLMQTMTRLHRHQSALERTSKVIGNGFETATLRTLQIGMGWFPELGGGLDRYYLELIKALPAVGVESFGIVAGSEAVAADTDGRVIGAALPSARLWKRWTAIGRQARRMLQQNACDLLVSHFALYACAMPREASRLPHVVHFHGPWGAESRVEGSGWLTSQFRARIERGVYRRADRSIVLSKAFSDVLCTTYGVNADRIRVIPGGVDCDRFDCNLSRQQARTELGWPSDRPIVLCVRRLDRRMGLPALIDASRQIRQRVPDALVLIAGKGKLAAALQAQIDASDLKNHARLLGFVSDDQLPMAYRAADFTVVPTVSLEGFGLIAAESLAAGTPCLVTPVGGLPEVVRDLSPELVLPAADAQSLADSLTAVLKGKLAAPSEVQCRQFARDNYDWPMIAARIRQVYMEVL